MADAGRPPLLTPEIQAKVVQALRLGNYRTDAAIYAGISPATFHRYMGRGAQEPDGPCHAFRQAVLEAESQAKMTALGCIMKAMRDGDWRAAAWYLARKYPEQFAEGSPLFLLYKACEQLQAAAEAAGVVFSESILQALWKDVAKKAAAQIPGLPGGALPADPEALLPEDHDLTEEERAALFKLVRHHQDSAPRKD